MRRTRVALAVGVRPRSPLDAPQVLWIRNPARGNLWELPGGHCEPGETFRAAAVREFWEETGRLLAEPIRIQRRTRAGRRIEVFVGWAQPRAHGRGPRGTVGRFFLGLPPRVRLAFPDDPYPDVFRAVRSWLARAPGPRKRRG